MKNIFGLFILFIVSTAHAEWRLINKDANNAQFFIDPSNVTLVDGYKRAWVLNNLPLPNAHGTRSFRSVEEFDCIEKAGRVMQIAAFDGEMASGNLMARRHGNGQWMKTDLDSVDHLLLEAACMDQP